MEKSFLVSPQMMMMLMIIVIIIIVIIIINGQITNKYKSPGAKSSRKDKVKQEWKKRKS